jgi:hypothetical protein
MKVFLPKAQGAKAEKRQFCLPEPPGSWSAFRRTVLDRRTKEGRFDTALWQPWLHVVGEIRLMRAGKRDIRR